MPVSINDKTFYRTSEVCQMACISRSTLLRWLRNANLDIPDNRDRRSWRLFTADDVNKLSLEANRICQAQSAPANNH
jgi:predicted site-specific integrase-resolvase